MSVGISVKISSNESIKTYIVLKSIKVQEEKHHHTASSLSWGGGRQGYERTDTPFLHFQEILTQKGEAEMILK